MGRFIDFTGRKFGRLTVLERTENIGRLTAWLCLCECGTTKSVLAGHLQQARIVSCGCWKKENSKAKATKHGKHGTKLHWVWLSMRQRCNNPKNKAYKNYGGRGISVCNSWGAFETFEIWALNNGYSEGLSIDRIENDGNYEPDNCRWIPLAEQNLNTRKNRLVDSPLGRMPLAELSRRSGVNYGTLLSRIEREVSDGHLLKPVPKGPGGGISLDEITKIMGERISWAPGLPLEADGFTSIYYKKD